MPDTGAPWNIPYVDPTDLVRDYPDASEDLADAIAAGLTAAGGLVEVKTVLKTDTFVSGSVTAGDNVAITGLSIAHETADPANKLIIIAQIGFIVNNDQNGQVGIALHDGTNLIGIGDADGSRTRLTTGGQLYGDARAGAGLTQSATIVHTPGAGSKTYEIRAVATAATTAIYVNRSQNNPNSAVAPLTVSSLTLMEVKV